jgi:hypothetical protein
MNFAYIDPTWQMDALIRQAPEPIVPMPCELDPKWIEFEDQLGKFKSEFARVRAEFTVNGALLAEKREEIAVLKMMVENINSGGLKEKLCSMIEDYAVTEDIAEMEKKCGELAGKVEAMKKVLLNTNAERYDKFTCFVCMERLVDLFIEPCGHVICERCWLRTTDKSSCPGCRARTQGAKKIFTMN